MELKEQIVYIDCPIDDFSEEWEKLWEENEGCSVFPIAAPVIYPITHVDDNVHNYVFQWAVIVKGDELGQIFALRKYLDTSLNVLKRIAGLAKDDDDRED